MKKILNYITNNANIFLGHLVPFLIPLAITLLMNIFLYYIVGLKELKVTMLDTLVSNIVSIAITTIGFLLTTVAILLSVLNTGIVKHVLSGDNLSVFKRYFYLPLFSSVLLIITALYISVSINPDHLLSFNLAYILLNLFSLFITSTIILFKGIFNIFTRVSLSPNEECQKESSDERVFKPDVTKLDLDKNN